MLKGNRFFIGVAAVGLAIWAALGILAHGNDHGKASATVAGAKVSVEYNRPLLKGRDISKMIQPGKLWRIGADDPTTIESDRDLDFGGTRVAQGKHILLARFVEPGKWTLVFSKKSVFDYEPSAKTAEVPLELRQDKDPVEELTIRLTNEGGRGVLEIAWGTLRLSAYFTAAK